MKRHLLIVNQFRNHAKIGFTIPELKYMYRMVAVRLWTLKGCPVNTIRFAMIRVVSGCKKEPVATRRGATKAPLDLALLLLLLLTVLFAFGLFQKGARLAAETNGTVNCGNRRRAVSQEPFILMDIVDTFASTTSVLTVDRVHPQSPRAHT